DFTETHPGYSRWQFASRSSRVAEGNRQDGGLIPQPFRCEHMDTMITDQTLLLAAPAETAPKLAAGRLPFMAFVDAETERVLQQAAVMLGRCAIMRGGVAKAVECLREQRSPHLLMVDISAID